MSDYDGLIAAIPESVHCYVVGPKEVGWDWNGARRGKLHGQQ